MNLEPISFSEVRAPRGFRIAIKCMMCGVEIMVAPSGAKRKTCSHKCKGELATLLAYQRAEKRPCANCGKTIARIGARAKGDAWCCSTHCKMVVMNKRLVAEGRKFLPRKPRRGEDYPCEQCGKLFYASKGERERGRRMCSRECVIASQTKTIMKTCKVCGREFSTKLSKKDRVTCGRECMSVRARRRDTGRIVNGKPARLDQHGYVLAWAPDHPCAWGAGWYFEHRIVMEAHLGRPLLKEEDVHHINGVKDDNRPENLQVMHHHAHKMITAKERKAKRLSEAEELAEYRKQFGPLAGLPSQTEAA